MKERPILFSGPMVNAILEGRKTQTRRAVKDALRHLCDFNALGNAVFTDDEKSYKEIKCPYGLPGDHLWVREAHYCNNFDYPKETEHSRANIHYRADDEHPDFEGETIQRDGGGWRPSIFMPRWASRITLEVTGIRVERLWDISEEDAKAEGVLVDPTDPRGQSTQYRWQYFKLWDLIHRKKHNWASNPFVWVVEFQRVK